MAVSAASAPSVQQEQISLLWPPGRRMRGMRDADKTIPLAPSVANDLQLEEVTNLLTGGDRQRLRFVDSVLSELPTDPAVITYRQAIVTDLLEDTTLRSRLRQLLPDLAALAAPYQRDLGKMAPFVQVATRAGELELHVSVANRLLEALEDSKARSVGLLALRDHLRALTSDPTFQALSAELPALRQQLSKAQSFTIGVNLTGELVPESAAIVTVSTERVEGRGTVLGRLFGDGRQALTPLRAGDAGAAGTPENRLYRDLHKLLEQVAAPVAEAIHRYATINARGLSPLEPELAFLLNGAALIAKLRDAGLPVCCPEVAPTQERVTKLTDGYNVSLALRMYQRTAPPPNQPGGIITNPVSFDQDHARVWILTGPNRGGKTTYTQMVGLAHVLFQTGLYVPASAARMSPVDAIYTHFPVPEAALMGMGRLDEEAKRLAGIFAVATPYSLLLLNEVLAGTRAVEGLGLALDAVRGMRVLGVRAIYTTHLHELALSIEQINAGTEGRSQVGSLVADVEAEGTVVGTRHRRTFRILPGKPRGVSYASEIAEQHGISFQQITDKLNERGVLGAVPADNAER